MSSRKIVMIIVVIILGFTAMSLKNHFTQEQAPIATVATTKQRILVAKQNLVSGAFVQSAQDLDWQELPEGKTEAETANYQFEGTVKMEDFSGAVVRRSLNAGEPISPSALMKSGEGGFLSAVLEAGKRAVSISVNITSGNAGFISPGDKVDLLITHRIKSGGTGQEGSATEQVVTETFANNVRVLAVDQMLDNPENKAILAKTITVEVTPEQAEQISVATELGKISMSLVSAANGKEITNENGEPKIVAVQLDDTKPAQHYTVDGDVSSLLGKQESATSKVRVIRGDKIETLEFYTDKK